MIIMLTQRVNYLNNFFPLVDIFAVILLTMQTFLLTTELSATTTAFKSLALN